MNRSIAVLILGLFLWPRADQLLVQTASASDGEARFVSDSCAQVVPARRSCAEVVRATWVRWLMVTAPPPSLENPSAKGASPPFSVGKGPGCQGAFALHRVPEIVERYPIGSARPTLCQPLEGSCTATGLSAPLPSRCRGGMNNGPDGKEGCLPVRSPSPYPPGLLAPLFAWWYPGVWRSTCPSSWCGERASGWCTFSPHPKTTIVSSTRHRGYYGDLYLWAILQPR